MSQHQMLDEPRSGTRPVLPQPRSWDERPPLPASPTPPAAPTVPVVPAAPAAPARLPHRADATSRFAYRLTKIVLGPILRGTWRPRVEGLHNIPAHGGVILASNHLSFMDSMILAAVTRRRVTFLAKSEYFTSPGVKGWLKRVFFTWVGQLAVDRNNEKRASDSIQAALNLLGRGEVLGIYPEGTRSPDGRLYRGKTGVARLALGTKVPVIPVAMIGTYQVLPEGRVVPRRGPVEVRIGAPLDLTPYEGVMSASARRSATDTIMGAIKDLSDQPYVDVYAQTIKTELGLTGRR